MSETYSFLPGRPAIVRKNSKIWVIEITIPNQRWPRTYGIFSSKEKAQAEIDARVNWRKHCKDKWKEIIK